MKKSVIILAGAIAFDLGVLVVTGQAAETPKAPAGPQAPALTVRKAGEKPVEYLKIKLTDVLISSYAIDRTNTAEGCGLKSGKVVNVAGVPTCQLPSRTTPSGK